MFWPDTSKAPYSRLIGLLLDQMENKFKADVVLGIPSAIPLPTSERVRTLSALWALIPLEARAMLDSQRTGRDVRSCKAYHNGVENGTLAICLPITDPRIAIHTDANGRFPSGNAALVLMRRSKPFENPSEVWAAESMAQQLVIPLEHLYCAYHPIPRDNETKAFELLKALANFNPLRQDERVLLENVCRSLKEYLGAVRVVVLYPDKEGNLRPRASAGLPVQQAESFTLPTDKSVAGIAIEEKRPIYVPDTAKEPRFLAQGFEIPSLLVAPLFTKNSIVGVLSVDGAYPHAFSQTDVYLVQAVATYLASAIENARLYRALKKQHEELQLLERKRSEIMENISHELRTPLTIVKGHLEILLEDLNQFPNFRPAFKHSLEVAHAKIRVMEQLTHDIIMALGNNERGFRPQAVNFCSIVLQAAKNHSLQASKKNILIRVLPCPPLQPVWGDPIQLEEVCDNLISNAIKYSPFDSTITLSVEGLPNFVHCAISDEGGGIPEDQKDKIFERFYQIESAPTRKYGGLGLGLAIVKKIVEDNHGGKIWVENNTPRKGATFFVDLPYARQSA